ncbi:MAG TPA: hypothetical protein VNK82_08410 [Terriglobales bacterium]|nr:hypothetical protein [Terriglobales bacterium]
MDEFERRFHATVVRGEGTRSFELSDGVPLTRITEHFVSGNELVLLGEAGRAQAVVIFDLIHRTKVDWFYCYKPQRLSERWIVYVEYYPALGEGEPTDVVLLYDLGKTPAENRLKRHAGPLPPGKHDSPIEVGVPIYPEANAEGSSYVNHVESVSLARHVLGTPNFLLLPSKHFVFVSSEGKEFKDLKNYVVMISLAEGMHKPKLTRIEIPKREFKKAGENPAFVKVTRLEEAAPNAVRLYVPESEYGVGSIVVELPGS